jgi:RNA polymerase primary sigma factor
MKRRRVKNVDVSEETCFSDENALYQYIQEISRIPLLSREEEEKTARLVAQGNKAARELLANSNLRFVIMIAKKYQGKGLALEDLISEGNIGLLNAIDHFDVEKGYRFITYAVWWIRQAVIKAIYEKGRMIRLPCNKSSEVTRMEKTREAIQNEPSQELDAEIQKVAKLLNISKEKASDLIQISQDVLSLDEPVTRYENPSTIKEYIEDECSESPVQYAINSILKDEVEEILNGLEERAAAVLRCRYGLGDSAPLTLKEIGRRYNLSRERIRQIEKRAMVQLQNATQSRKLGSYIA